MAWKSWNCSKVSLGITSGSPPLSCLWGGVGVVEGRVERGGGEKGRRGGEGSGWARQLSAGGEWEVEGVWRTPSFCFPIAHTHTHTRAALAPPPPVGVGWEERLLHHAVVDRVG